MLHGIHASVHIAEDLGQGIVPCLLGASAAASDWIARKV